MGKVIASITTSVDGYVTGPGYGPEGADREVFDGLLATIGARIVGRGTYDAAGAWGGTNPFPGTLIVLTHRLDDQPDPANGFHFVEGLDHALACARADAGDKDVSIGGGADVIRQALQAGVVDRLVISMAPVILGAGKRLFDGFAEDVNLAIADVHHSTFAVHTTYDVVR
jgi:dihydrofolate reductase